MSTTEKVTVTAEHIEQGKPAFSDSCPIALALMDAHPTSIVFVETGYAVLKDGDTCLNADLPDIAAGFVEAFDYGQPVGPIEFELTWQVLEATS